MSEKVASENSKTSQDCVPAWKRVLQKAILPMLSNEDIRVVRKALIDDDVCLMQGGTTTPPPLMCVQEWPVEACCFIGYIGWKQGLETVGEVEEFFARTCFSIDETLGEPAGCRWFLNWYDETPRDEMRLELATALAEEEDRRRELAFAKSVCGWGLGD